MQHCNWWVKMMPMMATVVLFCERREDVSNWGMSDGAFCLSRTNWKGVCCMIAHHDWQKAAILQSFGGQ